jgi:hypothetical protein
MRGNPRRRLRLSRRAGRETTRGTWWFPRWQRKSTVTDYCNRANCIPGLMTSAERTPEMIGSITSRITRALLEKRRGRPAIWSRIRIVIVLAAVGALSACGPNTSSQTAPSPASGGSTGSGSSAAVSSTGSDSTPSTQPTSTPASSGNGSPSAVAATSAPPSYDFELNQQFTSFSSSNEVTRAEEENAYDHVVFMINPPDGTSSVIDGNLSATPVPLTVTANSDGSTTIGYNEQTSNASIDFTGKLNNGTVTAQVTVSMSGGDVVDGTEYLGDGSGTVVFTAPVNTVTPDDVPYPPTGGYCTYSSDDGIDANWTPPSGGPSVSSYHVYEVNSDAASLVTYLGEVNQAGMDDESGITRATDADALSYLVYSVGPTGVDSLVPLTLTFLDGSCSG